MAKIITFGNQKGGVAKTTSSLNVSAALAMMGKKVLMVDIDPQASLTIICGFSHSDDTTPELSLYDVLIPEHGKTVPVQDAILQVPCHENLFLLPSDVILSRGEMVLFSYPAREAQLKTVLKPVMDDYDYIIIDCPPSLGLFTINALNASDYVIACCETSYMSYRGLQCFSETIHDIQSNELLNPNLKWLGTIATRHRDTVKDKVDILDAMENTLCPPYDVPYNVIGVIKELAETVKTEFEGIPITVRRPSFINSLSYYEVAELIDSQPK